MLLKQWALMAKKGKEYYNSDESLFFHSLVAKCFIQILAKPSPEAIDLKLCLGFLDFLNYYLSSSAASKRRFMMHAVSDYYVLIRLKVSSLINDP